MFRFTIDNWINQYLWPNQVHNLPQPFRQVLGGHTPKPVADYWIWLEILISSFCGIGLLEGVFSSRNVFQKHHVHGIVASYGATAILCFNAHQAPLSQPRNVLFGHFLASVIGVCIQKLFLLSEMGRNNYWASGALSVGILSVAMSVLNCVHPPAGASALLPSIDDATREIGWWFLPLQLVSSILMLSTALITGNIIRKYPVFWWSPNDMGRLKPVADEENVVVFEGEDHPEKTLPDGFNITRVKGLRHIEITSTSISVPEELNIEWLDMEWLSEARLTLKDLPSPKKS